MLCYRSMFYEMISNWNTKKNIEGKKNFFFVQMAYKKSTKQNKSILIHISIR